MSSRVTCSCGWSWNKSDSSKKDMYVCHQCGKDNTMKDGGWLSKYNDVPEAQNGIEGTMGGLTDVGFDYNGAWGGTMEYGGDIPQAQWGFQTLQSYLPIVQKFLSKTASNLSNKPTPNPVTGKIHSRESDYGGVNDLYNKYFGQPLKTNTVQLSKYRPTKEKDKSSVYYSVDDDLFKSQIVDEALAMGLKLGETKFARGYQQPSKESKEFKENETFLDKIKEPFYQFGVSPSENAIALNAAREKDRAKVSKSASIGGHQVSRGVDEKGEYISYYDVFDQATGLGINFGELLGIAKPFEMYDRIYIDPKTKKPKMAMGGSLPGSVGFTYARTQSPAPSNGKYAKKTKASTQTGDVIGVKDFYNSYLNSPKYKERLLHSGYSDPNYIINSRLKNIQKTKVKSGNESVYDTKSSTVFIHPDEAKLYNTTKSSILAHELSHAGGALMNETNFELNDFDINQINKRNKLSGYMDQYVQGKAPFNLEKMHGSKPNEFKADMDVLRYRLFNDKIYDAGKQNFNQDILNKAKQKYKGDKEVERLFNRASDKDLIWLMNNIAQVNSTSDDQLSMAQNGQEMKFYQEGLDWKPKSISKDGGWLDKFQEGGEEEKTYGPYNLPEVVIKPENSSWMNSMLDEIKSTVNPKNWFVDDYTDKGSFDQAFNAARKDSQAEFLYNNKRYSTRTQLTPEEQLKKYGITDEQLKANSIFSDRAYNTVKPSIYNDDNIKGNIINFIKNINRFRDTSKEYADLSKTYQKLANDYFNNDTEENRKKFEEVQKELMDLDNTDFIGLDDPYSEDAWNMYLGRPQTNKTFSISKYKPSISNNNNSEYYSLPDEFKNDLLQAFKNNNGKLPKRMSEFNLPGNFGEGKSRGRVLGNFKIDKGKDEKGEYISYYDNYDLSPTLPLIGKIKLDKFIGKPFEIYDRIYLNSKTEKKNGGWLSKYEEGGVIEDDMGQWAHPGEITKINSNQITMQGVDYPVLGISDTGDIKMMYPNEEYIFDGESVTEIPMAQKGRVVPLKDLLKQENEKLKAKSDNTRVVQPVRQQPKVLIDPLTGKPPTADRQNVVRAAANPRNQGTIQTPYKRSAREQAIADLNTLDRRGDNAVASIVTAPIKAGLNLLRPDKYFEDVNSVSSLGDAVTSFGLDALTAIPAFEMASEASRYLGVPRRLGVLASDAKELGSNFFGISPASIPLAEQELINTFRNVGHIAKKTGASAKAEQFEALLKQGESLNDEMFFKLTGYNRSDVINKIGTLKQAESSGLKNFLPDQNDRYAAQLDRDAARLNRANAIEQASLGGPSAAEMRPAFQQQNYNAASQEQLVANLTDDATNYAQQTRGSQLDGVIGNVPRSESMQFLDDLSVQVSNGTITEAEYMDRLSEYIRNRPSSPSYFDRDPVPLKNSSLFMYENATRSPIGRLNDKLYGDKYIPKTELADNTDNLFFGLYTNQYNNPGLEMRSAYNKVAASPKGSSFLPAGSLSSDSYPMSLRLTNRGLKSGIVDVNYHGMNPLNASGFTQVAGMPMNINLKEINTLIKDLNTQLPKSLPYAKIEGGQLMYPNFSVTRKKNGGWLNKYE